MERFSEHSLTIARIDRLEKLNATRHPLTPSGVTSVTLHSNYGNRSEQTLKRDRVRLFFFVEILGGQRPVTTVAKRSVAAFKLRKGTALGFKVTLRRNSMYSFIEKLVIAGLPTLLSKTSEPHIPMLKTDGSGNTTLGMPALNAFVEFEQDYMLFEKLTNMGLDITLRTSSTTRMELHLALSEFQFPLTQN